MRKCMWGAPEMDWERIMDWLGIEEAKGRRVKGSNVQAGNGDKCIPYLVAKEKKNFWRASKV